jgi:hypothetical protein
MKPRNSEHLKPRLSGLSRVSGFFSESPGFTLKTLSDSASHLFYCSSLISISFFQIMRVNIRHDTDEPSTQRGTKARHDPTTLRVVQKTLGQESSQRSTRPRRGDPPPSYAEGSKEEEIEEEEGTKVMMMRLRMTLMSSSLSLLAAMERDLLRRKLATNLIPRRATKPPT